MPENRIESVAVIGLGAIGSCYLAKISETLPAENLTVIASGERYDRCRQSGVIVNDRTYFFNVANPRENNRTYDLLIFAVKQYHLPQAIEEVSSFIGPDTLIISLLNGITSEEIIAERYGWKNLLYSYATGIDATREGNSTRYSKLGCIPVGDARNTPGSYSERVNKISEFFDRVGIESRVDPDMKKSLWYKFMLNVGTNQVTAIIRAGYGSLYHPGPARDLVTAARMEVARLAELENVDLTAEDVLKSVESIKSAAPYNKSSTLQDVEGHRITEVDIFGGTVLKLAEKHGIDVPVNEFLVKVIKAIESSYQYMTDNK